jgi:hypothetical protein
MGDAHSPVQAHSFGRILDALHASDQDAFATIAEIMPSQNALLHSFVILSGAKNLCLVRC